MSHTHAHQLQHMEKTSADVFPPHFHEEDSPQIHSSPPSRRSSHPHIHLEPIIHPDGHDTHVHVHVHEHTRPSHAHDTTNHTSSNRDINTVDPQHLLHLSELMASSISTEIAIQRVMEAATMWIHASHVHLFTVLESTRELVCTVSKSHGVTHAISMEGLRVPLENGIIGFVSSTGQTINLTTPSSDWRYNSISDARPGLTITSAVSAPVRNSEGKTIAVIEALNSQSSSGSFFSL